MAASASTLLPLLLLLLVSSQTRAQTADAPAPAGPPNITATLDKAGQFTFFSRLLTQTQVASQINTQVNSSSDGMTVFAPTDNAFNNLKPGLINDLSVEDQVRFCLSHVLYKRYSTSDLLTVSNPVRTQATGDDGTPVGLNFTGQGSQQVNVSTGLVTTPIQNVILAGPPLAVYQVDMVLLPEALFGVKPPSAAPAPTKKSAGDSNTTDSSGAPSGAANDNSAAAGTGSVGLGLVAGLGLLCMALFS